jgi:hypothetical protein
MSEETFYVFGLMDAESQGGFVELWSGPYASCVDFVNAPQFQLDLEMGVYTTGPRNGWLYFLRYLGRRRLAQYGEHGRLC